MRKGLAASTVKTYYLLILLGVLFSCSVFLIGMPLTTTHISTVCAFICCCMDVRHFKPQYICGLID